MAWGEGVEGWILMEPEERRVRKVRNIRNYKGIESDYTSHLGHSPDMAGVKEGHALGDVIDGLALGLGEVVQGDIVHAADAAKGKEHQHGQAVLLDRALLVPGAGFWCGSAGARGGVPTARTLLPPFGYPGGREGSPRGLSPGGGGERRAAGEIGDADR